MERRKDTPSKGEALPRDYLVLIEGIFDKNFSDQIKGKGKKREAFVVYGMIYPDEVVIAVSLKNPTNMHMTTCYGSMDFPPPSFITESGAPASSSPSDAVQTAVNSCIDVIASFFQTYFEEERPVDYESEYRQEWVPVDLEKTLRVFLRLNRDNLELEAASEQFLAEHDAMEESGFGDGEDEPRGMVEEARAAVGAEDDEVDPDEANEVDDDDDEDDEEGSPAAEGEESKEEPAEPAAKKKTLH
jgi:hypothetical protein